MLNFRTSIFKFADLSWSALANIKSWFRPDIVREGFNLESFHNNPSLKVVQVQNPIGQTIMLCPIEPCYLVNSTVNPEATSVEVGRAANQVDGEVARLAQSDGVTRFLIVVPSNYPSQSDERWIRIVERKVPQIAAMQSIDCATQSTTAQLN